MSVVTEKIARLAESAAVSACWRQWRSLNGSGRSLASNKGGPAEAIIDPEALVLMSLVVRHRERRLQDLVSWWAKVGASLMSVQRMRTLLAAYPRSLRQDAGWFASLCMQEGDQRWKPLAQASGATIPLRKGKGPRVLALLQPSTLMLRLRAGFGVGAKADVLTFLIGATASRARGEVGSTVRTISAAASYTWASISRALGDMKLARLVKASGNRPARFAVDVDAWARLLQVTNDIPSWRSWAQVYAFLAACIEWAKDARSPTVKPVVAASRARDVVDGAEPMLTWNGIDVPDPQLHVGERYLDAFRGLVTDLAEWTDRNV